MKKAIFILVSFMLIKQISIAQSGKIAIILAKDSSDQTDENYDKTVNNFLLSHFKKLSTPIATDTVIEITGEGSQITQRSGDFWDSSLTTNLAVNGKVVLVYYLTDIISKQTTVKGQKIISYGCKINLFVQIISTSNNQILGSKHYFGTAGEDVTNGSMIADQMGTVYYKTKDEAVKASLKNSSPDFTDDTKSMDEYLNTIISTP